jgi:hypothetical protein
VRNAARRRVDQDKLWRLCRHAPSGLCCPRCVLHPNSA